MSKVLDGSLIVCILTVIGDLTKIRYRHSPQLNRLPAPFLQLDLAAFLQRTSPHHKRNPFCVEIDRMPFLFHPQSRRCDLQRNVFGTPFAINGLWPSNNPELNTSHGHLAQKRVAPPFRHTRLERVDAGQRFARFLLWAHLILDFRHSSKSHGKD